MSILRTTTIVQFIGRNSFRKEITLIISLKLLALSLLWGLFFSHPLSEQLKKPKLVNHFIASKL